jgi:hypothetical protein
MSWKLSKASSAAWQVALADAAKGELIACLYSLEHVPRRYQPRLPYSE